MNANGHIQFFLPPCLVDACNHVANVEDGVEGGGLKEVKVFLQCSINAYLQGAIMHTIICLLVCSFTDVTYKVKETYRNVHLHQFRVRWILKPLCTQKPNFTYQFRLSLSPPGAAPEAVQIQRESEKERPAKAMRDPEVQSRGRSIIWGWGGWDLPNCSCALESLLGSHPSTLPRAANNRNGIWSESAHLSMSAGGWGWG